MNLPTSGSISVFAGWWSRLRGQWAKAYPCLSGLVERQGGLPLPFQRPGERSSILAGHFRATRGRAAAADGTVFVLHDTTEFTFQREVPERIGVTRRFTFGRHRTAACRCTRYAAF